VELVVFVACLLVSWLLVLRLVFFFLCFFFWLPLFFVLGCPFGPCGFVWCLVVSLVGPFLGSLLVLLFCILCLWTSLGCVVWLVLPFFLVCGVPVVGLGERFLGLLGFLCLDLVWCGLFLWGFGLGIPLVLWFVCVLALLVLDVFPLDFFFLGFFSWCGLSLDWLSLWSLCVFDFGDLDFLGFGLLGFLFSPVVWVVGFPLDGKQKVVCSLVF